MVTDQHPRQVREDALRKTESHLRESPGSIGALFDRACLLAELGRVEEAKQAFIAVLSHDPAHFGALNDFGNLLHAHGFRTAAVRLYSQAVAHHPSAVKGHVNLANVLAEQGETDRAASHFRVALSIEPDHPGAHRGLAYLLTEARREEQAAWHRQQACQAQPVLESPYRGTGTPIEVLQLVSAVGGSIPMRHHFSDQRYHVSSVFTEYFEANRPLPRHQIVFNAIGDADLCRPALEAAARLVAGTSAPVINHPEAVLATTRTAVSGALAELSGVVTPHSAHLPREALELPGAEARLAERGLCFPLLLRAPGFHNGRHFVKVDRARDLPAAVASLPGPDILAIEFIDLRNGDGKVRKYRVMMIGRVIYPVHAAVSKQWKIHYVTADMADHPEHRAEDHAFLYRMVQVLGPKAVATIRDICTKLNIDYGGIDFSIDGEGRVVVFEANASMAVYPADSDPRWDYRRPAVQRALDAVQSLCGNYAVNDNVKFRSGGAGR